MQRLADQKHMVLCARSATNTFNYKLEKMKKINIYLVVLLFGLFTFSSCEKENIDDTIIDVEEVLPTTSVVNNVILGLGSGSEEGLEFGCLTILYDFEMVDEEGVNILFTSDDEFFDYLEDSTNSALLDFGYPLEVEDIDDDGVNESVNDIEELLELFAECIPTGGWTGGEFPAFVISFENSCYEMVYPVSLVDIDGNVVIVNDAVELGDLLANGDLYFFEWPLSLVDEDDVVYTADSEDALFILLSECDDFGNPCDTVITGGGFIGCYEIVFPIDLVLIDGSVVTAADENEFFNLIFSGQVEDFSYPITLLAADGTEIIISDADALDQALQDCGFIGGGDQMLLLAGTATAAGSGCYEINLPIDFVMLDGSILAITTMDEYIENMGAAETLVYPVSVTLTEDGSVVNLEDFEDILILLDECEG